MNRQRLRLGERAIESAIFAGGVAAIVIVGLIMFFLFREGLPLFGNTSAAGFFFGKKWQPSSEPPQFGLLPNLWGSFLVTLGAAVIAVPLGVGTAVYIRYIAPRRLAGFLKGFVELMGAVPSVAVGFVGAVALSPLIKDFLHLDTGKSAIVGSVLLAFLAIPTITTIAEDAMSMVPKEYFQGSVALGATYWQTIYRVLIPAARPGIVAAIMLGLGRAIGETMVVIMVTGNAGLLPDHGVWHAFTHSVRTITGTIGAEALEVAQGEPHYQALFMLGVVLLLITVAFNSLAVTALGRTRRTART
ncbi:MAG: phosphate ABC transporter permease subunit PstC [Chthonomonadaceae bacterium]|nr:phosphate ABC transporter permease subunit PstC [Chthonomonadaceae bacterium]